MTVHNLSNIDPTECEELIRSTRLVCVNEKSNKDYQAVVGIHPKTKQYVSWVEWGKICDVENKSYKKQFKVHYAGTEEHDAIIPLERMLSKKASGKGTSVYTLENGIAPRYNDLTMNPSAIVAARRAWENAPVVMKPRKRIRAGNVLVPFAQRAGVAV